LLMFLVEIRQNGGAYEGVHVREHVVLG
jgi:hypothetical protein